MRKAVILAAGRGVRLGALGLERPKGFLELGGRPIVEEALLRLSGAGVERVVIVTGHCREHYERLQQRYAGFVTTVHNAEYRRCGSMYSLYCARASIDEPFLLLESDLIFEQHALDALVSAPERDCVLLSGFSTSGDEVFVWTDLEGAVTDISKRRLPGREPAGEFVGVNKISVELFRRMVTQAEAMFERGLAGDYETDCLDAVAKSYALPCRIVPDLKWAEIDDAVHLERARTRVYPQIAPIAAQGAGLTRGLE